MKNIRAIICIILFLFYLFGLNSADAQKGHGATVSGRLVDSLNAPVAEVQIALMGADNATYIGFTISDKNGMFMLYNLQPGKHLIRVIDMRYQSSTTEIEITKGGTQAIGNIIVALQVKVLNEIEIQSEKKAILLESDRMVVNVSNAINYSGSNAFEILSKIPGARLINDETISINGKSELAVYFNGQNVNLSGRDLAMFLRSLNSSTIESIEVIHHPSAKYDAAGSGGVIDIKTKKTNKVGYHNYVSFTNSYSYYRPKFDFVWNGSYRKKAMAGYLNYNYYNGKYRSDNIFFRTQPDLNDVMYVYDQHYLSDNYLRGHNLKAFADFNISKRNTIGFIVDATHDNNSISNKSNTIIFPQSSVNEEKMSLQSITDQQQRNNRINLNLNYHYNDSLSNEFRVSAVYAIFASPSTGLLPNRYLNEKGRELNTITYKSEAKTDIRVSSANADYLRKLSKGEISMGFKISAVTADNDLQYFTLENNQPVRDTRRTNHFIYRENIFALYTDYKTKLKSVSVKIGVRAEYTAPKGTLKDISAKEIRAIDSSYMKFFPAVSLNIPVGKNNAIDINYNKRIDRPRYRYLSPFEFVIDELNYEKGNQFLTSQTTNDIKVRYKYKNWFSVATNYTAINNPFLQYRDTINGIRTFKSPINLDLKQIYSVSASLQLPIYSWWDVSMFLNTYQQKIKGEAGGTFLHYKQNSFTFNGSSKFKLTSSTNFEVSGFYNSKFLDAPALIRPQWCLDAGVQQKFLGNAGLVKLVVTDIFNAWHYDLSREFGGLAYQNVVSWETRQIRLFLSYSFGNITKKTSNKDVGIEEERKRIR